MQRCVKKQLAVTDIIAKGYKVRFLSGRTICLSDMEDQEKKLYLTKYYYQIEKVYSKKGGIMGQRLNEYAKLLTPNPISGVIRKEKKGGKLPVRSEKLERKFLEDDRKLAKQYPTIGDKIQAAFVARLTNQERKELTIRLKRLGAKQVFIEDHFEGNQITTEPIQYIKYLFN